MDACPSEIERLRSAYSGRLITDSSELEPFLIDWRKTWRGNAIAVAQPDGVGGVAAIVRWCAENGVAIVPQGGNTGQSGGSVPEADGRNLVLSLVRLNRIRSIDPANNTITVDAGCILNAVQNAANEADRLFPLSLGAEGSCTIGGNLASNAGGTAVIHYGNMRDLCLGLEVVTAQGEVWDGLRALRKDNSGYDLRDLFIGSEGTLGVVTGAVLKLFPKPQAQSVALAAVASPVAAMTLFHRALRQPGAALTAFELMSDACVELVLKHMPGARFPMQSPASWYVLVEFSGGETACKDALRSALDGGIADGLVSDAVVAESLSQARGLWTLRESISEAQGREGKATKHDIAVPLSKIAGFVDRGLTAVLAAYPTIRPVIFGHLGDGNLHFNFTWSGAVDEAGLNRIVHDLVRDQGGTISAEHGLGVLRRDEAAQFRPAVENSMMAAIKHALDPLNIMNPGKLLPPARPA